MTPEPIRNPLVQDSVQTLPKLKTEQASFQTFMHVFAFKILNIGAYINQGSNLNLIHLLYTITITLAAFAPVPKPLKYDGTRNRKRFFVIY